MRTLTDKQLNNIQSRIETLRATAMLLLTEANSLKSELAGINLPGNSKAHSLTPEERAKAVAGSFKRRGIVVPEYNTSL